MTHFVIGCLIALSRDLTPPVDEAEEKKISNSYELNARRELERDGCPPCYPPGLEIPPRNPPERYKAIVQYWQSFPRTDDVVLCAQLTNWRAFRARQSHDRRRFPGSSFNKFVDSVRDRLRKHGLGEGFSLCLDLGRQSHFENWVEYLHHNLKRKEQFEKRRDRLKGELSDTIKAEDIDAVLQELGTVERDLDRQKVLLAWIDEQRAAMWAEAKVVNNRTTASKAPRRTYTRGTPPVLRNFKVSKSMPKTRKRQHRKPSIAESERTTPDYAADPSSTLTMKHRIAGQPRLQETTVKKQRRLSIYPASHRRSGSQPFHQTRRIPAERREGQGRLEHPPERRTRSGRISKPPIRWVPK